MSDYNFKKLNNAKQCHQIYFTMCKNPSKCGVFGAGRQTMPRGIYTTYIYTPRVYACATRACVALVSHQTSKHPYPSKLQF